MGLKGYIYTRGRNIRLVAHGFKDKDKTYPKPSKISFTIGTGNEVFDKYDIPEELQKIFFVVNNIGMNFMKIRPQKGSLDTKRTHRFKGWEFITDTEFYFAYTESRPELFGFPVNYPCNFDVNTCLKCDREEIVAFIQELRNRNIYDNYINAISEITNYRALSEFDEKKEEKVIEIEDAKELIKK